MFYFWLSCSLQREFFLPPLGLNARTYQTPGLCGSGFLSFGRLYLLGGSKNTGGFEASRIPPGERFLVPLSRLVNWTFFVDSGICLPGFSMVRERDATARGPWSVVREGISVLEHGDPLCQQNPHYSRRPRPRHGGVSLAQRMSMHSEPWRAQSDGDEFFVMAPRDVEEPLACHLLCLKKQPS